MKKFIKNILILLLIIIFIFVLIAIIDCKIIRKNYTNDYQRSVTDKIKRLKKISSPKIILVGDSNLTFGINSKMIEESLNMPVVNLGLHAGMGNPFNENLAKIKINENDIVIISHVSYDDEDDIVDTYLAWKTINYEKDVFRVIRPKDYLKLITSYPNYIRESIIPLLSGEYNTEDYKKRVYRRDAFNEYGDVVIRNEINQMDPDVFFKNENMSIPKVGDKTIKRINKLNEYVKEKHATLLVASYPIAYGEYSDYTKEDIEKFNQELKNKLDCEVISNFTEYMYPYDYFYDTKYHLTDTSKDIRTSQLITDLINYKTNKNDT